jgi:hypothetical protein
MKTRIEPSSKPLDLFGKRRDMNRWILFAMVLMTLLHAAAYWHLADRIGNQQSVIVMDKDTYYLSKNLDFMDAKDLHVDLAGLVMESLFDRSANGPDHPERLKRLCECDAYQEAVKLIEKDRAAFESKSIHQKVEIRSVQILGTEDDSVRIAVEGQLIRSGLFDGEPTSEALAVKMRMLMVRNPSILTNGCFPELLRSFQVETSPLTTP